MMVHQKNAVQPFITKWVSYGIIIDVEDVDVGDVDAERR